MLKVTEPQGAARWILNGASRGRGDGSAPAGTPERLVRAAGRGREPARHRGKVGTLVENGDVVSVAEYPITLAARDLPGQAHFAETIQCLVHGPYIVDVPM